MKAFFIASIIVVLSVVSVVVGAGPKVVNAKRVFPKGEVRWQRTRYRSMWAMRLSPDGKSILFARLVDQGPGTTKTARARVRYELVLRDLITGKDTVPINPSGRGWRISSTRFNPFDPTGKRLALVPIEGHVALLGAMNPVLKVMLFDVASGKLSKIQVKGIPSWPRFNRSGTGLFVGAASLRGRTLYTAALATDKLKPLGIEGFLSSVCPGADVVCLWVPPINKLREPGRLALYDLKTAKQSADLPGHAHARYRYCETQWTADGRYLYYYDMVADPNRPRKLKSVTRIWDRIANKLAGMVGNAIPVGPGPTATSMVLAKWPFPRAGGIILHDAKSGREWPVPGAGMHLIHAWGKRIAYYKIRADKKRVAYVAEIVLEPGDMAPTAKTRPVTTDRGPANLFAADLLAESPVAQTSSTRPAEVGPRAATGTLKLVLKETSLGKVSKGPPGGRTTIGPRSRHVAQVAWLDAAGRRQAVVLDGKMGKQYDMISGSPRQRGGGLVFSADGSALAYVAAQEKKWVCVVNGVEGVGYDGVELPILSRDGKRVIYQAKKGRRWVLVVNGKEQREHGWRDELRVTPDGRNLAFVAGKGDKPRVVFDGNQGGQYESIRGVRISPDGKRVVYMAKRDGKWRTVMNGREGNKTYEAYDRLFVSADCKRTAFRIRRGGKWIAVIDGKEGAEYDMIDGRTFVFSRNGRKVVYFAKRGEKWIAVVDGVEQKAYDRIDRESLVVSVDGASVAYATPGDFRYGIKSFVVLNGKEQRKFNGRVRGQTVTFSPDGRRLAYVVDYLWHRRRLHVVVTDEKVSQMFPDVRSPVFSPDGRHVAYLACFGDFGKKWKAVVDGVETKGFTVDRVEYGDPGRLVFNGSDLLNAVIRRGNEYFRLEVKIVKTTGK